MHKVYILAKDHNDLYSLEANLRAQDFEVFSDNISEEFEHIIPKMQMTSPEVIIIKEEENLKALLHKIKEAEVLMSLPIFVLGKEEDEALKLYYDYFVDLRNTTWEQAVEWIKKVLINRDKALG